jgi:DNA-binding GntR family transcriptional regulator
MKLGLYEELVVNSLERIDEEVYQVQKERIDGDRLPKILSKHFSSVLEYGLNVLKEKKSNAEEQINFCNYLIDVALLLLQTVALADLGRYIDTTNALTEKRTANINVISLF